MAIFLIRQLQDFYQRFIIFNHCIRKGLLCFLNPFFNVFICTTLPFYNTCPFIYYMLTPFRCK